MMINKAPAPAPALMMSKLFFVSVLLASVAVVKAERVIYSPNKKADETAKEHAIDVARPSDHQMEATQKKGEETVGRTSRRTTDPLPDAASTASTPLKRSVSPDAIRPDPFPIAGDDEPSETAEEAAVDVGVLEAASVPAGTGRRLEATSAPSFTPCPAGYVDCVNGNVAGSCSPGPCVTCSDFCAGECCYGTDACYLATACIEKDKKKPNCDGDNACLWVGINGASQPKISGGSCVGSSACAFLAGTVGDISKSCTGNSACRYLASYGGKVGAITNSCTANLACNFLASDGGTVGDISNSCTADRACLDLAYFSGEVGDIANSCTASDACRKLSYGGACESCRYAGTVGDISDSCTASSACELIATGYGDDEDNIVNGGSVGNIANSCQLDSCRCKKHCYANSATIPNTGCDGGVGANVMNYCVATSSKSSKKGAARSSKSPKLAKNAKTAKAF